jgi:hypothetical protein
MLVSVAVLYNFVFVIGRAVFWELNNAAPALWWTLDYTCDIIYLLDILVHAHEGKRKFPTTGFHLCMLTAKPLNNGEARRTGGPLLKPESLSMFSLFSMS